MAFTVETTASVVAVSLRTVLTAEVTRLTTLTPTKWRRSTVLALVAKTVAPVGKRAVGTVLSTLEPFALRTLLLRPGRAI